MSKRNINIIETFCKVSDYLAGAGDQPVTRLRNTEENVLRVESENDDLWGRFVKDFLTISDFLRIKPEECLVFVSLYTIQVRRNTEVEWNDICDFLHVDAVRHLPLRCSLSALVVKGIIYYCDDFGDRGYKVRESIETAMLNNKFPRKVKESFDRYQFCQRISRVVHENWNRSTNIANFVEKLEQSNKSLPIVVQVKALNLEPNDRAIFYNMCDDFLNSKARRTPVYACLKNVFNNVSKTMMAIRSFLSEKHPLQTNGLVELCGSDFMNEAEMMLTEKAQQLFLEDDYELFSSDRTLDKNLRHPEDIREKRLYFSGQTSNQLDLLKNSLMEGNMVELQQRLENTGMLKGITVLLQGGPGTGKTEAVMQLARATGRSVYHVDISACKSKWFGESEKIVKDIFNKYRQLCKREKLKPILLFNEADAIFSKRRDVSSSNVAQTENAIQNILLEEMETLDGILIATTNLFDNFDNAFARRFLFKVEFGLPTTESKRAIWKDKLPWLSDESAEMLAQRYNLSGGEIDNITRKSMMEEILNGCHPDEETLSQWCSEEKSGQNGSTAIGFVA